MEDALTTRHERTRVSAHRAYATVMVPVIELWISQWMGKLPAAGIVSGAVPPAGTATSNEPSSAVTV